MDWKEFGKKLVTKKEPEIYTPQREYIDRRHDNLQRQLSFYQKKSEIPMMEAKIKAMEKQVYGNGFKTPDSNNIMKAHNMFRHQDGMLSKGPSFSSGEYSLFGHSQDKRGMAVSGKVHVRGLKPKGTILKSGHGGMI